jgi:hypothetical protein
MWSAERAKPLRMCSGTYNRATARAKRLVQRDFTMTDGTLVLLP